MWPTEVFSEMARTNLGTYMIITCRGDGGLKAMHDYN